MCAALGSLGYLALLTPKNNPLFDVVVTNPSGTRAITLQVKTRSVSNKAGWKLGRDIETKQNNPNLYVALVELKKLGAPDVWIYEYDTLAERVSDQFKKYIGKAKKDGQPRKDPGFRWHDLRQFTAADKARKNNHHRQPEITANNLS